MVSALTKQDELDGEDDPVNWLALALAHRARGDEQPARELYERALTWMAIHPALRDSERLWFRAQAAQQLGLE